MAIESCEFPASSSLDGKLVSSAFFRDSYRAPLRNAESDMPDIFFSLFGHHPRWVKAALLTRNRLAAVVGLEVPRASDIQNPEQKASYHVGDQIGPWPIFNLSDHELIAGRNNAHLDFRLSLLKEEYAGQSSVVVSTVCNVHNLYGKIYLFFIVPFHKWGIKRMIARAVRSGRL